MDTQQVIVIRRTPKSTRTPPNTPRRPVEQHHAQRERSSRFLQRFRLTAPASVECADAPTRDTRLQPCVASVLQPARPLAPRRAQTVDLGTGSAPGWLLLASMRKGRPDAGSLRRAVSSALGAAGNVSRFVQEAGECLQHALQLSGQDALDVATRCSLGDLLHQCRVLQALLLTDEPASLTGLIEGLLQVAEFDPGHQPAAKLAAARRLLEDLERRGGDERAIDKARDQERLLAAVVEREAVRRVSDALRHWGLEDGEIAGCLADDDARRAFVRLFDACGLHAGLVHGRDGRPCVGHFAPITASSGDVADIASALAAQAGCRWAVPLLAGHLLGLARVDDCDDSFPRLLRLCATLGALSAADGPSRRTLLKIVRHLRLLIDCGAIPEHHARVAQRLLSAHARPCLDDRLARLDVLDGMCRVLRAAASDEWLARNRETLLQVAAEVALDCPGGGREAIEQLLREMDRAGDGRWHPAFLARLADRAGGRLSVETTCERLRAEGFPFTLVRSTTSSAVCWESDPSVRGGRFRWERHGSVLIDFAHARLDRSLAMDPAEVQQWFDILRIDRPPRQQGHRAALLALAMRAIGRSKELLNGIPMRECLERLASEPRTVHLAIAHCGVDAFQACVELAAHTSIVPRSKTMRTLQKHAMDSEVFAAVIAGAQGRRMLDDLLGRVVSDPSLLERRPLRDLLRRLIDAEACGVACRLLQAHPMLQRSLLRSDAELDAARIECLLQLPLFERRQCAAAMEFKPPEHLSFVFAPERRATARARQWSTVHDGGPVLDHGLRIAVLGAAIADDLGAPARAEMRGGGVVPLADGLILLHEALPHSEFVDPREQAQHLVDVVRVTLRLLRERPDEATQAFFRLVPPLNDPAELESWVTSQGGRSLESPGRAMRSKGEAGLFAFAGLLTCLYLIEDKPLPVAESFEAARLARLMCAALWRDAGRGLRCRQQLGLLAQHAPRVQHWLLAPSWFAAIAGELETASAAMHG